MSTNLQATYSMIVARLLEEKRENQGISQAEFLGRAGLTQSSWSRVNRGLSHFSLEELRAACIAVNADITTIIGQSEMAASALPDAEGVSIIENTKASDNKSLIPTIIAAAALGFLIARLMRR